MLHPLLSLEKLKCKCKCKCKCDSDSESHHSSTLHTLTRRRMANEIIERVRYDAELQELEMLLDEIPHATSHHHHHHHGNGNGNGYGYGYAMYNDDDIKSPMSGFSLQSEASSSTMISSSSNVPSPSSCYYDPNNNNNNNLCFDSKRFDSTETQRLLHELGLCANFGKMHIADNRHHNPNVNMLPFHDFINNAHNTPRRSGGSGGSGGSGDCYDFNRGFSDSGGFQSPTPTTRTRSSISYATQMNSALSGLTQDYNVSNLFGSQWCEHNGNGMLSQLNGFSGGGSMDSPRRSRQLMNDYYCRESVAPELEAASLYERKYGMSLLEERGMSRLPNNSLCTSVQELLQCGLSLPNATRGVPVSNARIPQGNLDDITSEGSFIIQGEGLNYVVSSRGLDHSRTRCQRAVRENGFAKQLQRSELDIQHHQVVGYENFRSTRNGGSLPLLPKYNSLAEAQESIYLLAKDQHGCRFLQKMFDEGTLEDVRVIFNEIIDHVVELMMNPFGNYLMQKLLDVCDEEQRMQIILVVTEEPGQFVKISLNTHGTRVVQKLIETLKTRQQISLVVSALEPGFLALIKDLNGNHVVQHCLQCLSNEDNKFIFVAAAKYCVGIATHQHGCCVLQRCIGHSRGGHREKLIEEISANALRLAQDQYGNYVVQFILDLRIPSATATLSLQFEGKYVHMSMQKFSSHVVEKCLAVFNDENRLRVIHELLSAPHFELLLQDPHANYVVQSALRHSEGRVHNLLVEAIESRKAISRNSPYSKKIFSQKLLKK